MSEDPPRVEYQPPARNILAETSGRRAAKGAAALKNSYYRSEKKICCGRVLLRMVINGLVVLSLATLCTFVILFLLALFHGYYQMEMFFIMLTTVLSFLVSVRSSGVELVAMRGTSIDVPLK